MASDRQKHDRDGFSFWYTYMKHVLVIDKANTYWVLLAV